MSLFPCFATLSKLTSQSSSYFTLSANFHNIVTEKAPLRCQKKRAKEKEKNNLVACELIQVWTNRELPGDHEPPCSSAAAAAEKRAQKLWLKRWKERSDRATHYPTADMSFQQPLREKIIVVKQYFPPCLSVRPVCAVVVLWQWVKAAHIRNLTPSYGRKSDVQSYWCTLTVLYLHRRCEGAAPCAVTSGEGNMDIFLIGGTAVQSEVCPSVQCQTFKPSDFATIQ